MAPSWENLANHFQYPELSDLDPLDTLKNDSRLAELLWLHLQILGALDLLVYFSSPIDIYIPLKPTPPFPEGTIEERDKTLFLPIAAARIDRTTFANQKLNPNLAAGAFGAHFFKNSNDKIEVKSDFEFSDINILMLSGVKSFVKKLLEAMSDDGSFDGLLAAIPGWVYNFSFENTEIPATDKNFLQMFSDNQRPKSKKASTNL